MAIGIDILKYKEYPLSKIYYYHVSTSDFGEGDFYVTIDSEKLFINFYKTSDFTDSIGEIDLNLENPFENKIDNISQSLSNLVGFRSHKAIKNNDFPEQLGFSS
ncbi:MAG: hypothetical protein P4L31_01350 [Candidatus Babeliales bacterium]|nr:hypothetical protein [Candidatus Babeliales bacterium]